MIGNVGDDDEFFGLHVSPDLDSLVYALAGLNDEQRGWGRRGETWNALETAKALGDDETWFQLGDRDLGLHLVRTKALRAGEPLSAVTARIAACVRRRRAGPARDRRPAAHDRRDARRRALAPGVVRRARRQGQGRRPALRGRRLREAGAGRARGDRAGVARRDRAQQSRTSASGRSSPSARSARGIQRTRAPVVAVSPLVGGKAVKGPADAMLRAAGRRNLARPRRGLLRGADRRARHRRGGRGRGRGGRAARRPPARHPRR